MKAREVLAEHLARKGIGSGDGPGDWYREPWFRARVRGRSVPVWPVAGLRGGLALHDLHHLITGDDTTVLGEVRLAGWELSSGGCRRRLVYWVDRALVLLLALPFAPRTVWRALRDGRRCRNLYRFRAERVLECEMGVLRRYVFGPGVGA